LYSKASGYNSIAVDAEPIRLDTTFWIASCTKLVGTIAVLQCVQRGQLELDERVENVLPELANPGVISDGASSGSVDRPQTISPARKKITLRHLLCHTSGLAYDIFGPTLAAWRAARGEYPQGLSGDVTTAHAVPLLFEPGESWAYGGVSM
jgi:CubicO group peptidase (beta-lactamase class C family)